MSYSNKISGKESDERPDGRQPVQRGPGLAPAWDSGGTKSLAGVYWARRRVGSDKGKGRGRVGWRCPGRLQAPAVVIACPQGLAPAELCPTHFSARVH